MVFAKVILLNISLLLFCEFVLLQIISLEDNFLDNIVKIYPLESENPEVSLIEPISSKEKIDSRDAVVTKRDTKKSNVQIKPSSLISSIVAEKGHNEKNRLQDPDATKLVGAHDELELHITGDKSLLQNANIENEDLDYESNPVFMPPIENDVHQREERQEHKKPHNSKTNKIPTGPKIWDHWGKWSPCSVTCGVGKLTRWRHCVQGGCASGEKEAQIKTCTSPAC